jgi:hypothetical protein
LTQAIYQAAINKNAWMLKLGEPGVSLRYSGPNRAAGTQRVGTPS